MIIISKLRSARRRWAKRRRRQGKARVTGGVLGVGKMKMLKRRMRRTVKVRFQLRIMLDSQKKNCKISQCTKKKRKKVVL